LNNDIEAAQNGIMESPAPETSPISNVLQTKVNFQQNSNKTMRHSRHFEGL